MTQWLVTLPTYRDIMAGARHVSLLYRNAAAGCEELKRVALYDELMIWRDRLVEARVHWMSVTTKKVAKTLLEDIERQLASSGLAMHERPAP